MGRTLVTRPEAVNAGCDHVVLSGEVAAGKQTGECGNSGAVPGRPGSIANAGCGQTTVNPLPTQQCAALHRHGRDGGRGAQGSAGSARDPHGGGPAGGTRPGTAVAAAQAALAHGRIGYTEALGIPSLRARIARHYGESYDLALDPGRVAVTTGSSGGFILAFLSLFEAGDRVALANPGYPPYRHILSRLAASRC